MSINLGELRAKITVATSEANNDVEKFQDKLSATSDVLSDVGGRLTTVGALGVGAIGALTMKGAEWNAQVAGTQFLYDNLDKSIRASIESQLKNAEAIGLTTQQYKDGATNISTYYKNMGLTTDEISKMSSATMELVADLGAVVDLPFDEALARFKSGLMGNYEALDIFGISISASMLESSEFVKSLGKKWNALSDNEKMMAVYNEIVRQGASAQGLARQEAGEFSMQMKLLKQEISETAGTIGETLLPILQPFLETIKNVVVSVKEWVQEHPKITGFILATVGAISLFNLTTGALILTIASCISTFLFWSTVLAPIGAFLKTNLIAGLISSTLHLGIFKMNVGLAVSSLLSFVSSVPLLSGAIGLIKTGIGWLVTSFMALTPAGVLGLVVKGFRLFSLAMLVTGGDMKGFVTKVIDGVKKGLEFLVTNIPKWIEAGKELVLGIVKGIAENLPTILEKGKEIAVSLYEGLVSSIDTILEVGAKIIEALINGIVTGVPIMLEYGQKILQALGSGLINGLPWLLDTTVQLIDNITLWIEKELPKFIEQGTDILVKLIEGMTLAIPQIVDVVIQIIEAYTNAFATYFPLILETGINILTKLIEGIVTALPFIVDVVVNIIEAFVNAITTLLPMILEVGVNLLTSLIEGIVTALPMLIEVGVNLLTTLIDAIVEALPMLIEVGIELLLTLVDAIVEALPMLVNVGVELIIALVEALVNNLPLIISAGGRILEALVTGILKLIFKLVEAGAKLVITLGKSLIQNLPTIVSAGGQLLTALVKGILQLIGSLINCGLTLVTTLVKSIVQNAPKMLGAGKDLVTALIKGLGSLAGSLLTAGKNIVSSILSGIKSAWGSLTSWVSSSISNLNPFKKKMIVGVEGTVDESGIAQINDLARNGITARPSHFGFTPRNGLFNLDVPTPKAITPSTPKEMFDTAKEIVVNTVVELEGYQIAKATARYMQDELNALDRRATRLGGVL